jgi:uncharacterized protein with LGFP repeats
MRRTRVLTGLLTTSVVVPLGLVLPVVTAPAATAHPVKPLVQHIALSGTALLAGRSATADAAGPVQPGPAVLTAPTSVRPFRLLGLTWDKGDAAPTSIQVRVRTGGAWSPWGPLDVNDDLPDADTAEGKRVQGSTEPLLDDLSDGYQVRVDTVDGRVPAGLTLQLVDPGSSPADGATASTPASTASAGASAPTIVTRAQWGADESLRDPTPQYTDTIKAGFVHHTASSNSYWTKPGWTSADAAKDIRSIYAYSVATGYADIPYNFLVDQAGRIYEGRAGGITLAVKGAATGGFNDSTMSVSALGNFETARPTSAMVGGFERILAWKLGLFHVNPAGTVVLTSHNGAGTTDRYGEGVRVAVATISGHRNVGGTLCPGGYLYAYLPSMRAAAVKLQGAALYNPTLSASLFSTKSGPPLTLTAGTPQAQTWVLTIASSDGTVVRTLSGATAANVVTAVWNGRNGSGGAVANGVYTLVLSSGYTASAAPAWTGTVSVSDFPPPPTPNVDPLYWSNGTRIIGGREYVTTCSLYGTDGAILCRIAMESTYWVHTSAGYVQLHQVAPWRLFIYDWAKPSWNSNILAVDGTFTYQGLAMRTTCTATGKQARSCTTEQQRPVLQRLVSQSGRYYFLAPLTWVVYSQLYLADTP